MLDDMKYFESIEVMCIISCRFATPIDFGEIFRDYPLVYEFYGLTDDEIKIVEER